MMAGDFMAREGFTSHLAHAKTGWASTIREQSSFSCSTTASSSIRVLFFNRAALGISPDLCPTRTLTKCTYSGRHHLRTKYSSTTCTGARQSPHPVHLGCSSSRLCPVEGDVNDGHCGRYLSRRHRRRHRSLPQEPSWHQHPFLRD